VLEEMRIRGLGVITDAVLELDPGLTVVTGETGAGKTMVVTGLSLLLGGRADAGVVRAGESSAVVEGRVLIDPDGPVAHAAQQAGAELDEDALLLTRTVTAAGRSRAHLGGRAVPVGVLAELAVELVTVHGQSDQLRLLRPTHQRQALDRFAGHDDLVEASRAGFDLLRAAELRLDEVTSRARERAQEADLLRLGLAEVAAGDPQPGEDLALREEDARLAHADALRAAAEQAHSALRADGEGEDGTDVAALVAGARRALTEAGAHDPVLREAADRLGEVAYLVGDLAADLASYAAGIESDPTRLAVVQQRRAELTALTRKYGEDADAVLTWAEVAQRRLAELDDDDTRVERLTAERDRLRAEVAGAASRLSASRTVAAGDLAGQVAAELAQLAMPNATLTVQVTQRDAEDGLVVDLPAGPVRVAVGSHGADDVELLLAPHAGAPARPVAKGASGGELSRVMLALEVVLAGADPVPTFVFDEVDAGVGGRAAVEIGRRLAALARRAQVIVVTHLPQVAAYADRHLIVVKADDGQVTESGVRSLDEEARVAELARMLAGHEDSDTARAHARELRAAAAAESARGGPGHVAG
jgi:DNA repair protein RecN (Recombination protein N)